LFPGGFPEAVRAVAGGGVPGASLMRVILLLGGDPGEGTFLQPDAIGPALRHPYDRGDP
jgi:hypothetical protein